MFAVWNALSGCLTAVFGFNLRRQKQGSGSADDKKVPLAGFDNAFGSRFGRYWSEFLVFTQSGPQADIQVFFPKPDVRPASGAGERRKAVIIRFEFDPADCTHAYDLG